MSPSSTILDGREVAIDRFLSSTVARASAWIGTCASYFAAATAYEQLSRLSNVELHRRGFSRRTLARDICEALDK
jgi:hypothetical protein